MSAGGTTLVLNATGTVTVNGVITMDGHGYAGGGKGMASGGDGLQGASYTGAGDKSPYANGGGGEGAWCSGLRLVGAGAVMGPPGSGKAASGEGTIAQGGATYGDANLYAVSGFRGRFFWRYLHRSRRRRRRGYQDHGCGNHREREDLGQNGQTGGVGQRGRWSVRWSRWREWRKHSLTAGSLTGSGSVTANGGAGRLRLPPRDRRRHRRRLRRPGPHSLRAHLSCASHG